jgi:uncharacterized protein YqhQ
MYVVIDYLVFLAFLLMSMIVGIYHGIAHGNNSSTRNRSGSKKITTDHEKTNNFLIGNKKLPILPVTLSLLTTFISGISLLAIPAEIYERG